MRGRHTMVLGRLRLRRRQRGCVAPASSPEPPVEGVIYLTPDGDGYILYANRPGPITTMVAVS